MKVVKPSWRNMLEILLMVTNRVVKVKRFYSCIIFMQGKNDAQ